LFINKIKKYIKTFNLFKNGERILIGLSGGLDSVALLETLLLIKNEYNFQIFASHYDHKIRKDSYKDVIFVYKLCKEKNIPLFCSFASVPAYAKREKISLEMAGRELRYNLWYFLAKKYNFQKIVLAHHLDDLTEEIFMRLIKGTGKRGLAGIPIKRDLIVRPFLFVTKDEIRKFALERNLTWREDYTNQDIRFMRNKIRHILIPFLEQKFNKNIKKTIGKTALVLAEEEEFIEELAKNEFEKLKFYSENELNLDLSKLKKLHPSLRKRIYFLALKEIEVPLFRITYTHIESIENLIIKEKKGPVYLPGDFLVYKEPSSLRFSKKVFTFPYFEIIIDSEGEYILPTNQTLKVFLTSLEKPFQTPNRMIFSGEKLSFPFIVRKRKPGDRIFFKHLGHKKLKKFFSEKKIPSSLREKILIFEHKNEIIGIWNLYVHPDYIPDKHCNKIVVIEVL